jgi:hypothetical protein
VPLRHYLYVGDFFPEHGLVRFFDHQPVAAKPINTRLLESLIEKYFGALYSLARLPEEFGMSLTQDFIICDFYGAPREVLFLLADYAQQEGAIILDQGAHNLLLPSQLVESAAMNPPFADAALPKTGGMG